MSIELLLSLFSLYLVEHISIANDAEWNIRKGTITTFELKEGNNNNERIRRSFFCQLEDAASWEYWLLLALLDHLFLPSVVIAGLCRWPANLPCRYDMLHDHLGMGL
jgi:hypothetical protein